MADEIATQIQATRSQLASAQSSIQPAQYTAMQLRSGGVSGQVQRQAYAQQQEAARQQIQGQSQAFETAVAQQAPEYATPELRQQAYNQAVAQVNTKIQNVNQSINQLKTNIDYFYGLSQKASGPAQASYEKTINQLQDQLNLLEARKSGYQEGLTGSQAEVISKVNTGYVNQLATYKQEVLRAGQTAIPTQTQTSFPIMSGGKVIGTVTNVPVPENYSPGPPTMTITPIPQIKITLPEPTPDYISKVYESPNQSMISGFPGRAPILSVGTSGTISGLMAPAPTESNIFPTVLPTSPAISTDYAKQVLAGGPTLNIIPAGFNLPYQIRGTTFTSQATSPEYTFGFDPKGDVIITNLADKGRSPENIKFVNPPPPLIEKTEPGLVPSLGRIATQYFFTQTQVPITEALIKEGTTGTLAPFKVLSPGFQFRIAQVGTALETYGPKYESLVTLRNQLVDESNKIIQTQTSLIDQQNKLNQDYTSGKVPYETYIKDFNDVTSNFDKLNNKLKTNAADITKLESQKEFKEIQKLGTVTTLSKEMEGGKLYAPGIKGGKLTSIEIPYGPSVAKGFYTGVGNLAYFTPLRYALAPIAIGGGIESISKGQVLAGATQVGLGTLSLTAPVLGGLTKAAPGSFVTKFLSTPEVKIGGRVLGYGSIPIIGGVQGLQEYKISGSLPSAIGVGIGGTAGLLTGAISQEIGARKQAEIERKAQQDYIRLNAKAKSFELTPNAKQKIFRIANEDYDITAKKVTDTRVYGIKVTDPITGKERDFAYVEKGKLFGGTDLEGRRDFIGFELKDGDVSQRLGNIQVSAVEKVKDQLTAISTNAVATYNEPPGLIKRFLGKEGKEVSYSIKADETIKNIKQITYANPGEDPIKISVIKGNQVIKTTIPAKSVFSYDQGIARIDSIDKIKPGSSASYLFPKDELFNDERFAENIAKGGFRTISDGYRVYTPTEVRINIGTGTAQVKGTEVGLMKMTPQYGIEFTKGPFTGGPIKGFGETPKPSPSSFTFEYEKPTSSILPSNENQLLGRPSPSAFGPGPVTESAYEFGVGGKGYISEQIGRNAQAAIQRLGAPSPPLATLGAISTEVTALTLPRTLSSVTPLLSSLTGAASGLRYGSTQQIIQPQSMLMAPSQVQVLSQIPVQRETQIPTQLLYGGQTQVQVPSQAIIPVQIPVQTQIQIPSQALSQIPGTQPIPIVPPTTIGGFFFKVPLQPPKSKLKKKRKIVPGFEVQVRRRGKFIPYGTYAYPREEALAIGAKNVLGTARASFRIVPSTKELKITGARAPPGTASMFRAPKRSTGIPTYIQRRGKRITSPGEIREISLVGAAARRTGKRKALKTPGFSFMKKSKSMFNYLKGGAKR